MFDDGQKTENAARTVWSLAAASPQGEGIVPGQAVRNNRRSAIHLGVLGTHWKTCRPGGHHQNRQSFGGFGGGIATGGEMTGISFPVDPSLLVPAFPCQKPSKIFFKTALCRLSGSVSPSSHDRTKVCAIPIFAATWPDVRFLASRSIFIQSPIVLMLIGKWLCLFVCPCFWLNLMRICRCAIPNRATLPKERENGRPMVSEGGGVGKGAAGETETCSRGAPHLAGRRVRQSNGVGSQKLVGGGLINHEVAF